LINSLKLEIESNGLSRVYIKQAMITLTPCTSERASPGFKIVLWKID